VAQKAGRERIDGWSVSKGWAEEKRNGKEKRSGSEIEPRAAGRRKGDFQRVVDLREDYLTAVRKKKKGDRRPSARKNRDGEKGGECEEKS